MLIHMLSALWTLTSLSAVCLKEGDAHCFYLRRLGPSRTARSVWHVTSGRSPQFQGTPPLRRDDTGWQWWSNFRPGLTKWDGRGNSGCDRSLLLPRWSSSSNCEAIAHRTWTTWSQWPTQETPQGWVSLQTHDVAVDISDWTGSISGAEHSEATRGVPISRGRASGCGW